jgi:hypothetical protein
MMRAKSMLQQELKSIVPLDDALIDMIPAAPVAPKTRCRPQKVQAMMSGDTTEEATTDQTDQ